MRHLPISLVSGFNMVMPEERVKAAIAIKHRLVEPIELAEVALDNG